MDHNNPPKQDWFPIVWITILITVPLTIATMSLIKCHLNLDEIMATFLVFLLSWIMGGILFIRLFRHDLEPSNSV